MKIEQRYGDLLTTDSKYIAHCVNAQGKMRSGVAKAIREAYPKAYDDYIETYNTTGLKLGKVILSKNEPHNILHIVGQENYGYDGRVYLSYKALRVGVRSINRIISEPVSFPLIGCGLAGGNWQLVQEILEQESTNFQPIVYLLNDEIKF